MKKRFISFLTAVAMVLTMMPQMSFVAHAHEHEQCEHHIHNEECGYVEASEGTPCTHTHDADCGYIAAVEEVLCECTQTDENGALQHTENCGYAAPAEEVQCGHSHDENCSYTPAVEAQACTFSAEDCAECGIALLSDECQHLNATYTWEDEDSHEMYCSECGEYESIGHYFGEDEECDECGYTLHTHTAGADGICTQQIGDKVCGLCAHAGERYYDYSDAEHWLTCSKCYYPVGDHAAHTLNENGRCDCGYCAHTNATYTWEDEGSHKMYCPGCEDCSIAHGFGGDTVCDECGYTQHTHTAGTDGKCTYMIGTKVCGLCAHAGGSHYEYNDQQHWLECSKCYYPVGDYEEHNFDENNKCTICDYVLCLHQGDSYYAYDTYDHWQACSDCYESLSAFEGHNLDENGACTVCDYAKECQHEGDWYYGYDASAHWQACSDCDEKISDYEGHDFDGYGECTVCDYVQECQHLNGICTWTDDECHMTDCPDCNSYIVEDHRFGENGESCEDCGYIVHDHKDDNSDSRCDVLIEGTACGMCIHSEYAEYEYDDEHHWKICAVCEDQIEDSEEHQLTEGKCACGYCAHINAVCKWDDEYYHTRECPDCQGNYNVMHDFDEDGNCTECEYTDHNHAACDYDQDGYCDYRIGGIACGQCTHNTDGSTYMQLNDTDHAVYCDICEKFLYYQEHTYENGICDKCGHCGHTGGYTYEICCEDEHDVYCAECGEYLDYAQHEDNGNYECKYCGMCAHNFNLNEEETGYRAYDEYSHGLYCKYCDENIGYTDHFDADNDGKCDECAYLIGHEHIYTDAEYATPVYHTYGCELCEFVWEENHDYSAGSKCSECETSRDSNVYLADIQLKNGYYVDNNGTVSKTKPDGGYAYYKNGKLTLNNFSYSSEGYMDIEGLPVVICALRDLEIVIKGENEINSTDGNAIATFLADLTFSGDGKLMLSNDVYSDTIAIRGGNITFKSGDITLKSGDNGVETFNYDEIASSIFVKGGKLTIESEEEGLHSDSNITITGGEIDITNYDDESFDAYGGITITGGKIKAYSDEEVFYSYEGDIKISGGEFDLTSESETFGFYYGDIIISDGFFVIESDDDAFKAEEGDIIITGGTFAISAEEDGLDAWEGDVKISDAHMYIYSGCHGIWCQNLELSDSYIVIRSDVAVFAESSMEIDSNMEITEPAGGKITRTTDGDDAGWFITNSYGRVYSNATITNHTHDWKFTVNGNKLTAVCKNTDRNCYNTDGGSFTINAPENCEYDGKPKKIQVEDKLAMAIMIQVESTVYGPADKLTGKLPVNVGEYTASITVLGYTLTLDFEIVPASFDTNAPVITGITDGAVYCSAQTFTVEDESTFRVVVNGKAVTDYTLAYAENTTYTVVVTDEAGNSTTATVTMKTVAELAAEIDDIIEDIAAEGINSEQAEKLSAAQEALEIAQNDSSLSADEKSEIQSSLSQLTELAEKINEEAEYAITAGTDSSWTKGSTKTLGFTASGLAGFLKEVRVDGNVITRETDYTIGGDSDTFVTLDDAFLGTLSTGKHTLEIVFDVLGIEEVATSEFTVKAKAVYKSEETEKTEEPAATQAPAVTTTTTAKPTATVESDKQLTEEADTETATEPAETPAPTQAPADSETGADGQQTPQAESGMPIIPIILAAIAAILFIFIIFKRKKEEEE